MNVRKQLISLSLISLASAACSLPALADYVESFKTYDVNHDNMWDYKEFAAANAAYYTAHPKEVVITQEKMHHDFDSFDPDHDGFVKVEEVRKYHTW